MWKFIRIDNKQSMYNVSCTELKGSLPDRPEITSRIVIFSIFEPTTHFKIYDCPWVQSIGVLNDEKWKKNRDNLCIPPMDTFNQGPIYDRFPPDNPKFSTTFAIHCWIPSTRYAFQNENHKNQKTKKNIRSRWMLFNS